MTTLKCFTEIILTLNLLVNISITFAFLISTKQVGGIRNELSHMGLKEDMRLSDQKVKEYFQDIDDFLTCLENLHPQHFSSAKDVRAKLNDVRNRVFYFTMFTNLKYFQYP